MYGYSFDRPARHMREYLSVLAAAAARRASDVDGRDDPRQHRPDRAAATGRVPVLLAAMAPAMLRLAGERADGTVLWMTGPATVAGLRGPGPSPARPRRPGGPTPRVVCILPVCVTDDPDLARPAPRGSSSIYGQLPSYRAMLDREGAAGPADVAIVGRRGRRPRPDQGAGGGRGDRLRRRRVRQRRRCAAHPRPAEVPDPLAHRRWPLWKGYGWPPAGPGIREPALQAAGLVQVIAAGQLDPGAAAERGGELLLGGLDPQPVGVADRRWTPRLASSAAKRDAEPDARAAGRGLGIAAAARRAAAAPHPGRGRRPGRPAASGRSAPRRTCWCRSPRSGRA